MTDDMDSYTGWRAGLSWLLTGLMLGGLWWVLLRFAWFVAGPAGVGLACVAPMAVTLLLFALAARSDPA